MDMNTGMKEEQYLSTLSKKKGYRALAWMCLIIIAVLVIATLVTGVMGSRYFIGCLVLCIIVPIFMYVVLWMGKVLYSMHGNDSMNDKNDLE